MNNCDCMAVAGKLASQIKQGAFLTVRAGERLNTMTIGWGLTGFIWQLPVFMVAVRDSRYTFELMEAATDFTVSLPYGDQAQALKLCGTKSGRDYDKFAECGFTAMPAHSQAVSSPWIKECGAVWECRTVAVTDLLPEQLSAEVVDGSYPRGDFHRLYFGEVVACHSDPDFVERFAKAY